MWLTCDPMAYESLRCICDTDYKTWRKAELIEETAREFFEDFGDVSGLWNDLVQTALGRVNWYEIAEAN